MSTKLHFEDFTSGTVALYGPRLVTREEIIAFASEFDPQPMHLDEEAARLTPLRGLGGSGWHACCVLMRIIADGFVNKSASMGATGVEEVRWIKPLRPDSTVRVRKTVLEARPSRSRPEMGLVKCMFELIDERDEVVTSLVSTLMIGRRAGAVA